MSILFLLSIMWMFIDDNDDDFKAYQKEYRHLEIGKTEAALEVALAEVEAERKIYEEKYNEKVKTFESEQADLDVAELLQVQLKGEYYKANMEFLGQKLMWMLLNIYMKLKRFMPMNQTIMKITKLRTSMHRMNIFMN